MRFDTERDDPDNAGLGKAVALLRGIQRRHPWMSLADMYVLGGYVAIEATGGPAIPFSTGRRDFTEAEATRRYGTGRCPFGDGQFNPSGSRLPAADLGPDPTAPRGAPDDVREKATIAAMRGTFERMGFDDRETVVLMILGHQYGRCHPDVSGFEGSWYGFGPAEWNIYTHGLGYLTVYSMLHHFDEVRTPQGKRQWNNRMFGNGTDFMVSVVTHPLVPLRAASTKPYTFLPHTMLHRTRAGTFLVNETKNAFTHTRSAPSPSPLLCSIRRCSPWTWRSTGMRGTNSGSGTMTDIVASFAPTPQRCGKN